MSSVIGEAVRRVTGLVVSASAGRGGGTVARLVAVSKTKPVVDVQAAYDAGQRDFGENYVQELAQKAPLLPSDVRWRFIGKLQSNKVKALLSATAAGGIHNLHCVETVDSRKLATRLNTVCGTVGREAPLHVMVQLNTSGEGTKSGVADAAAAVELARYIEGAECARLRLAGLMTIGLPADETCFAALAEARDAVGAALGRDPAELELSMGMSGDFEQAIACGATSVRVGSTIFGVRPVKLENDKIE